MGVSSGVSMGTSRDQLSGVSVLLNTSALAISVLLETGCLLGNIIGI